MCQEQGAQPHTFSIISQRLGNKTPVEVRREGAYDDGGQRRQEDGATGFTVRRRQDFHCVPGYPRTMCTRLALNSVIHLSLPPDCCPPPPKKKGSGFVAGETVLSVAFS